MQYRPGFSWNVDDLLFWYNHPENSDLLTTPRCMECYDQGRNSIGRNSSNVSSPQIQVTRYCDQIFQNGSTTSGRYNMSIGARMVEVFCELGGDGNNWLVRKSWICFFVKSY